MYPILCKVNYETLHQAFRSKELWIQVGFSIIINWIVAPFLMVSVANRNRLAYIILILQLALAWAFLPDEPGLREGLVLVGLARCIAMVSVEFRSRITNFTTNTFTTGLDLDWFSRWRQPILRHPSGHQFRVTDRALCAVGYLFHQHHQPFQVGNHGLLLDSRH